MHSTAQSESDNKKIIHQRDILRKIHSQIQDSHKETIDILKKITWTVSYFLKASRVSIWLIDRVTKQLTCLNLYELYKDKHTQGEILDCNFYPEYYDALLTSQIIDASNARIDKRTTSFTNTYFEPTEIFSMLDFALVHNKKTIGVLCIEQQYDIREWKIEEKYLAASLADLIVLALYKNLSK